MFTKQLKIVVIGVTGSLAAVGPALAPAASGGVNGAPPLMSADWAKQACTAWNADPVLTKELVETGWIENNGERGFKVLHVYRTDCPNSPRVEMKISPKDGKATCVYGGPVATKQLNDSVDYVMHAKTAQWEEMGRGEYGPMRAMMSGSLKFSGPRMEAMGNMGPFKNFLLLTGKVDADTASCPKG